MNSNYKAIIDDQKVEFIDRQQFEQSLITSANCIEIQWSNVVDLILGHFDVGTIIIEDYERNRTIDIYFHNANMGVIKVNKPLIHLSLRNHVRFDLLHVNAPIECINIDSHNLEKIVGYDDVKQFNVHY